MNKYRIGDTVYPVKTTSATTEVQCKACKGEVRAYFKNGNSVECDYCTNGNRSVSYRTYETVPATRIQGVREFTGVETKYYSEGEWEGDGYWNIFKMNYFMFGEQKKYTESYLESHLFTSECEAEAFAASKNRSAENEALENYWKSKDDDNESDY